MWSFFVYFPTGILFIRIYFMLSVSIAEPFFAYAPQ